MGNSGLFYCRIQVDEKTETKIESFIKELQLYSEKQSEPIYVIDKALGKNTKIEDYEYGNKLIILIPKKKIMLINCEKETKGFEEFREDFISDLEYLSKKYEYQKKIGRSRKWEDCIEKIRFDDIQGKSIDELLTEYSVLPSKERIIELLISLLIGSINNIDKLSVDEPKTLLDRIKQKIVLFDGMQSRFLYEDLPQKIIRIQGLAGTGKTELLLHKLSEIYVEEKDTRMAFTCYNKVLAREMNSRIPRFFNFLKIDEQIEDSRLLVCSSWGSRTSPKSGIYSYICDKYNLTFQGYMHTSSFDEVCEIAVSQLEEKGEFEKCFDYMFIDESQDFGANFIKLCQLVTKEKIYVAGDVFQNVFDTKIKSDNNIDYLLNKCYRTDPRTLMIAHSIGMGLYEKPVIRWLDDEEWKICGYLMERTSGQVLLKRAPLRRFEDIDPSKFKSIKIISSNLNDVTNNIINCLNGIVSNNPTVKPEDIAIVFLENNNINYEIIDKLFFLIKKIYNWHSTKGYIVKEKEDNHVFISNINNIKGLEFPFVICVETGTVTTNIRKRNSIYMVLTRSFICSYFILNSELNKSFIDIYDMAINNVDSKGYMELREPSKEEIALQEYKVRLEVQQRHKSVEDMIDEVCDEYPFLQQKERREIQNLIAPKLHGLGEKEVKTKVEMLIKAMF